MPGVRDTALLGAALALAAALFDAPVLYVPGFGLLALAGGSVAWVELAARGLALRREPGPAGGVEGELHPLSVVVERRPEAGSGPLARLPLPGGELRDPALESPISLPPGPPRVLRWEVRLGRRGRRRLAPTALVLSDPLGLHRRELRSRGESELLVLPRTEPVRFAGAEPGADGGGVGRTGRGEGRERGVPRRVPSPEVDGLRPHEDGAPASRIHWPTVARTGELFDRRLTAGGGSAHSIALEAPAGSGEAALDRAVRAAASLCLRLAPEGGCALLLPGRPRPLAIDRRLGGWPEAHAALALVEQGRGAPAGPVARGGLAILVSPAGNPAAAAAAAVRGVTHIVLATPLQGRRPDLEVAGCFGYGLRSGPAAGKRAEAAA